MGPSSPLGLSLPTQSTLSLLLDDLLLLLLLCLCLGEGRLLLMHAWPETTDAARLCWEDGGDG